MNSNPDTRSAYFLQLHISVLEIAFSKIMLSSKNASLSLMASTCSIYMFIFSRPFDGIFFNVCFPVFELPVFANTLWLIKIGVLHTHPTTAMMFENAFSMQK